MGVPGPHAHGTRTCDQRRVDAGPWLSRDHASGDGADHLVDADRFLDVLDFLLADIGETGVDFVLDLIIDRTGDAQAAGIGESFEPCGDVHAVAVDIVRPPR